MAKKKKEERQAKKAEKRTVKAEEKKTQALDEAKIKMADDSYKESKKANRKRKRTEKKTPDVGPATFNKPEPREPGVTNVVADPESGTSTTTKYPTMAEYTKANPESAATSTISGKDPKSETTKNIIEKATTYGEMKSAESLGDAVKSEVDAVTDEADKSEFALDAAGKEKAKESIEDGTRNTGSGYDPYDTDGYAIKKTAEEGTGGYGLTDDEFARAAADHRRQNAAAKAAAPAAAIENMGIEHYYPPQQDFVTSNFTGRYIGSRQIVAATGGLFPEGLVDARKRAQEAKAKAKAEGEEKYWELTNTAPQYDEDYKDIGMDMLNKYYEASGGDIQGLLTGNSKLAREFQRDMYDYKSRGKNLEDVNTTVIDLVKTLNSGDEYIPPEIIKNMYDFRTGTADMDAYMKGEALGDDQIKRISNTLRSYQNFTPLAIKQLEVLKGLGANELPFAAGSDFNDPTFASNAREAIEMTKHRDYDEFKKVTSKFWDVGEMETIVRDMYDKNNLYEGTTKDEYEEQIQNGVRYMMANLPDVIDIDQKMQTTKALGWATLAQKKHQYSTSREDRIREMTSMWDDINTDLSEGEMRGGAAAALALSKDPKQRAADLEEFYSRQDKTVTNLGGFTVAYVPTRGVTQAHAPANRLTVLGKDGKMYSVDKMIEFRQDRLEINPNDKAAENELKELRTVKNTSGDIQHHVAGRYAGYGVYDETINSYIPAESYNGEVTSDMLINMGYESGKIGIVGKPNAKGEIQTTPSTFTYVNNANIEADETRRSWANREAGEEKRSTRYREGEERVTGTGSSGGSSTSY
jgi:hypothetical protein